MSDREAVMSDDDHKPRSTPKLDIAGGVILLMIAWFIASSALRYAGPFEAGLGLIISLIFAIPGAILLINGGKKL